MVLVLALGLAACSGDDDGAEGGDGGDSSEDASGEEAAVPEGPSIRMISLNQLHGVTECGAESTEWCQAADRMSILFQLIEDAGCPELVGLTEVAEEVQGQLLPERLPDLCEGSYELLYEPTNPADAAMILTSLPIVESQVVDTAGPPWEAHWAQVESDLGPIDFLMTHFASSSFNPPCDAEICPPICETGVELGTCNAVEVVDFLEQNADPEGIAVIAGDLNQTIDNSRLAPIVDAGYQDVWTLAGNPECDPATGEGCTCCVAGDRVLDGLDAPDVTFDERIDFILARPPEGCELEADTPDDANGNGTSTGIFAGTPADPPVNGIYWPADHAGVQAELFCA